MNDQERTESMRVVIIGGSGHVGTYLVPMLVESGHEVINITRGQSDPYLPHAAWKQVQRIVADRDQEDAAGTFGARIRDLKADVVIDMICFTESSARQIVDALRGQVSHFLHCGTIWAHANMVSRNGRLSPICSIRRGVAISRLRS
jgi:nucleoside-diphosphate-sugar epimerase